MRFNNPKSILTMETINSKRVFEAIYFYAYPLILLSGLVLRLYLGEISFNFVQDAASTIHIPCIFHWMTALDCPGCGITRSLTAMYLWSPVVSFYFHPLGPIFAFMGLFYWLSLELVNVRRWFDELVLFFNAHAVSALLIVIAWGIFRNF